MIIQCLTHLVVKKVFCLIFFSIAVDFLRAAVVENNRQIEV